MGEGRRGSETQIILTLLQCQQKVPQVDMEKHFVLNRKVSYL